MVPLGNPIQSDWINSTLFNFLNRDSEVILLHVVDSRIRETLSHGEVPEPDAVFSGIMKNAESRLHEAKERLNVKNTQTMVVEGIPFMEIIKISKDLKVDMIAMKSRSSDNDIENFFFGSTAERIVRGSSVPVIVLP